MVVGEDLVCWQPSLDERSRVRYAQLWSSYSARCNRKGPVGLSTGSSSDSVRLIVWIEYMYKYGFPPDTGPPVQRSGRPRGLLSVGMTRDADPIVFLLVGCLAGVATTLLASRIRDFLVIARDVVKLLRSRGNRRKPAPFGPLGD
jgi:hypothetical protein